MTPAETTPNPLTHLPVMLAEVMHLLAPRADGGYLDATFGGGGYAAAVLATGAALWAIDRDPDAIARGAALAARHPGRLHLLQGGFGDMMRLLDDAGVQALDGVVLDLGLSSFQIDDPARGFSFRTDGPLDMRMQRDGPTAADLVATLDEADLADVLYRFGEERLSRRIARAIVRARGEAPITTTTRLAEIVRSVVPREKSGIDPATRSFQALRIRVNDELGQIERALDQAARLLRPGGRLVVVSFHSLEDRLVKRFMTEAAGRMPAPSRHDPGSLAARPDAAFRLLTPEGAAPGRCRGGRQPACPQRPTARRRTPVHARSRRARPAASESCMIRPFTFLCMLLAGAAGLYLYQVKHRTRMLELAIEHTVHEADAARARTALLRAESAVQNDPTRLASLAAQYLTLKPIDPKQFVQMTDIGHHLPAIPVPEAAPATAEPAEDEAPAVLSEADVAPAPAPAPPAPQVAAVAPPAPAAPPPHPALLASRLPAPERHDPPPPRPSPLMRRLPPPLLSTPVRFNPYGGGYAAAAPRTELPMTGVASALGGARPGLPPPVPMGTVLGNNIPPRDSDSGR